jgi:hypothetical protein
MERRKNLNAASKTGRPTGYKKGGKVEQDFTGLMKKAADRAAAKGTPVMKQGGATNEYTAKRVMSRIKAGNFKDGGRAELLRDRRMKDIEKDYKIALAKGKNEGVAKAKYEQRKADAADDYAKRTKGDRTKTKAGEKAAEAALTEARRTKGESITKRDMAADFKKYFAGKDMTPKAAEPVKAAAPAAAPKPQSTREEFNAAFKAARAKAVKEGRDPNKEIFMFGGEKKVARMAGKGTGKVRTGTGTGRTGTGTSGSNAGNASAPVRAPATGTSGSNAGNASAPVRAPATGAIPTSGPAAIAILQYQRAAQERIAKERAAKEKQDKAAQAAKNIQSLTSRNVQSAYGAVGTKLAKGGTIEKYAAGGAGKVRKGMMKGK